ncbi:LamG-like jellyroll fold domain-containing protein [Streptomyces sp. NBC_01483]|uniref:LamG-like jellyroll fold domain-containing protein n=1 Tax=Streptomyces sp. NBC_01483 TaxID=2903883 RepID=UPI002E37A997|nr:LamG-like jellyroll fold domain-containing protein [Streptomyces sp. NBC_01483]
MNPPLDRRHFLAVTGTSTASAGGTAHASSGTTTAGVPVTSTVPDAAARVKPFSLSSVTLLDSAFRANQRRNSAYLRFVDIDRLLHTFRTNVGLSSTAQPCGGWEGPSVELRGHSTGHLLSGLALAYADTGAFKQQPSFMGTDPDAYSTDYDNFSCDHGTGMETQAKFADTVYSHDRNRLLVDLFIPSQVNWRERNITWRQTTSFPDRSSTVLTVTAGRAAHQLLVRIPSWAADARAKLNGRTLPDRPEPGSWLTLDREWRAGDRVEVSLPMRTVIEPTPDDPDVQAVLHGPVVLAGAYGERTTPWLPRLDTGSVRQESRDPLRFTARADGEDISLLPISRVHHQHYSVYWQTGELPPPPPEFIAWHRFDETSGTAAADATGNGRAAQLAGGATWTAAGFSGGAVALDGTDGHVHLSDGLLAGAAAYTLATWVRLDGRPGVWSRVFDLGTGVTANMFLTPRSGDGTLRYAITAGGAGAEQRIDAAPLPTDRWVHVAVAYGGGTAVLYVDGQESGRNTQVTVEPRYFGNHIRAGYLGRSQYADPYLRGTVDDFRVYGKTLTAEEVAALAQA